MDAEESPVESSEHQDNDNIHCQPFPESVSEEREIYTDYDGCHRHHVKHYSYLSAHVGADNSVFPEDQRSHPIARLSSNLLGKPPDSRGVTMNDNKAAILISKLWPCCGKFWRTPGLRSGQSNDHHAQTHAGRAHPQVGSSGRKRPRAIARRRVMEFTSEDA